MSDRLSRAVSASVGGLVLPVLACAPAPRTVELHARNYAFEAPATLPAGPAVFRLINDGSVLHEVQIFRFHQGISADSAKVLLSTGPVPIAAYDISASVLITTPATTAREQVLATLESGDVYGLLCEFRDGDSLPKHSTMGMWAVLRVE